MSKVRDTSGVLKTLGFKGCRGPDGTFKTFAQVKVRDAGSVLCTLTGSGSLTVSLSPSIVSGSAYGLGSPRILTSLATIAVTGGTAPYTVIWEFVEDSWEEQTPNALATKLRSPPTPPASSEITSLYAIVTDANGLTGSTNSITATVSNEHPGV